MRRFLQIVLTALLCLSLCACAREETEAAPPVSESYQTPEPIAEPTPEPAATAEPAPARRPGLEDYETAASDWAEEYRLFVENNFDVLAALWPDGMSGVGFIDLDLDGIPELLLFDMGASATLGVQLFDLTPDGVCCVSSVNEAAAAAFGGEHFSPLSVCASYFEDFRLRNDGNGAFFCVKSANGSLESSWEEQLRFGCGEDSVLTLASVCRRSSESDAETGELLGESFRVGGEETDSAAYDAAAVELAAASDLGYEAAGVFLWNDMDRYDTSCEGLLVMLDDAAAAYVPLV